MQVLKEAVRNTGLIRKEVIETCYYRFISKKELKNYKTNSEDYLLSCTNKWIEPRTYRRFFERTLKKANVEKINFHGLRHTFATNCIKLGVDYKTVSELLGHTTVNITLNLYVHPQMSQKKKCINLICKNFQEKVLK